VIGRVHVKICGITRTSDALAAVELGASAIGLNFVPGSPRRIDAALGADIARAVAQASPSVLVVGVVADLDLAAMKALIAEVGLGCLQLHGSEPPEALVPLLPHAYKAVRISTADDVARARAFPGEHLLADAKADGLLGGSGQQFDWTLVRELARERKLTLAGGLRPDDVARAIAEVQPYCLDVASGVESAPGIKDRGLLRAFLAAAREA
jgi:phosphoribosylanthranilate isomerase